MPTRKKIANRIAAKMNLTQVLAQDLLQQVFDELMETLVREKRLELRKFGVFELRVRAPRTGRNPKTNECMNIPQRMAVAFKPGKEMVAKIAALSAGRVAEKQRPQSLTQP
jgi:DNA-binding protein HU-beta/integration host factor subunit beta